MPEPSLKQFRSKSASLWQSAVDKVVAESEAAATLRFAGPYSRTTAA